MRNFRIWSFIKRIGPFLIILIVVYLILVGVSHAVGEPHPWFAAVTNNGELIGIVFAIFVVYVEIQRKRVEDLENEIEKEQTARYWVFYNARNRINQDLNLLREIYGQLYISKNESDQVKGRALIGLLKGFEQTWQNDDVLNSAIAFEFTLLSDPEKRAVMRYFEHYNALEDHVSMLVHSLPVDILQSESSETSAGNFGKSETLLRVEKETSYITATLRNLIREAVALLQLMYYVEGENEDLGGAVKGVFEKINNGADMSMFAERAESLDYQVKLPDFQSDILTARIKNELSKYKKRARKIRASSFGGYSEGE